MSADATTKLPDVCSLHVTTICTLAPYCLLSLLQAVADIAKQQIVDASEAAQKEKEAAVTKGMQSVQRRASKEALIQVTVEPRLSTCTV